MKPAIRPSESARRQSRQAILEAAVREFGARGMEGARTSAIARGAGVNQALLYYYFHDKDSLYCAVFEEAMASRHRCLSAVFASDLPPGEKVLRFALGHFDFLVGHAAYPRLMMETASGAGANSRILRDVVARYVRPMSQQLIAELNKGMESGEFRQVDAGQFTATVAALPVFYFVSAPVFRMVRGVDPLSAAALRARRNAILDTLAASLFADREHGIRLAARILQEEPLPLPKRPERPARSKPNRRQTS